MKLAGFYRGAALRQAKPALHLSILTGACSYWGLFTSVMGRFLVDQPGLEVGRLLIQALLEQLDLAA